MVNKEIPDGDNGKKILRQKRLKQAIKLIEDGILKLLIFKEEHGLEEQIEPSKTKRVVNTTEAVLHNVKKVLESRNSDSFRDDLSQRIEGLSFVDMDRIPNIGQIEDSLSFVKEEKSGKMERQLYTDLRKGDARILWYIETLASFGIIFDDEEAIFQELKLLCDWDSYLEIFLQEKILSIISEYKRQKVSGIQDILGALQDKRQKNIQS